MGQQEYDFFATSRPAPAVPDVPEPAPSEPPRRLSQFGQAVDPQGRAVNQFGTPIEQTAAPAGPAAAPGYGAQAFAGPGLTGAGPAWVSPAPAHRLPTGAYVTDPAARPPTVLAAGIVAIVQGVLAVIVALLGFAALSVLESGFGQVQGGAELTAQVSGFVRLVLFIVLAIGALYLVAGIGCAVGRRWAAWTLLVVEAVGLVVGIIGLVDSSTQTGGALGRLVGLAVPVAVLVLLALPRSRAWLQSR